MNAYLHLWLIPLAPFAGFLFNGLLGRRLPKFLVTAMIRCGENSLPIYCLSVLLSFVGHVILVEYSGSFATQVAVSIAGILLMSVVATLLTYEARLDRHGPRLF